jgi:8-oxo-dGTP pyrophosphatase MutT (NUDIX family)
LQQHSREAIGMSASASTEFSAGGVVVRGDECVVIVPTRRAADGSRVLALPKGHPEPGESPVQAALREVREEAGIEARLVEELGDIRYWYMRDGRRISKVVSFFLLRYVSGEVDDHDREVEHARWLTLEDAARDLTYEGERDMVSRALSRVRTA